VVDRRDGKAGPILRWGDHCADAIVGRADDHDAREPDHLVRHVAGDRVVADPEHIAASDLGFDELAGADRADPGGRPHAVTDHAARPPSHVAARHVAPSHVTTSDDASRLRRCGVLTPPASTALDE
jgi:hypothetical protein